MYFKMFWLTREGAGTPGQWLLGIWKEGKGCQNEWSPETAVFCSGEKWQHERELLTLEPLKLPNSFGWNLRPYRNPRVSPVLWQGNIIMATGLCPHRNLASRNWKPGRPRSMCPAPSSLLGWFTLQFGLDLSSRISKTATPPPPRKSSLELLSGRLWNRPESQLAHVSAPFPWKALTIRSRLRVRGMQLLRAQPQVAARQIHLRWMRKQNFFCW